MHAFASSISKRTAAAAPPPAALRAAALPSPIPKRVGPIAAATANSAGDAGAAAAPLRTLRLHAHPRRARVLVAAKVRETAGEPPLGSESRLGLRTLHASPTASLPPPQPPPHSHAFRRYRLPHPPRTSCSPRKRTHGATFY
eukprot:365996-Chlamydomonas_euryale.AAC.4